jgi:hypothetical protein
MKRSTDLILGGVEPEEGEVSVDGHLEGAVVARC